MNLIKRSLAVGTFLASVVVIPSVAFAGCDITTANGKSYRMTFNSKGAAKTCAIQAAIAGHKEGTDASAKMTCNRPDCDVSEASIKYEHNKNRATINAGGRSSNFDTRRYTGPATGRFQPAARGTATQPFTRREKCPAFAQSGLKLCHQ
jgi:hypothetical protein